MNRDIVKINKDKLARNLAYTATNIETDSMGLVTPERRLQIFESHYKDFLGKIEEVELQRVVVYQDGSRRFSLRAESGELIEEGFRSRIEAERYAEQNEYHLCETFFV